LARNNKSKILKAAYDLFVDNGFDNTSIKMIADRAGVSKGNIYNFYDSKELLFKDVLRMANDNLQSKMIAVAIENKDMSPEVYIEKYAIALLNNREEAVFILSSALTPKLRSITEPLLKDYNDGMVFMMKPLFPDLSDVDLYNIGCLLLAISDSFLIDGDKDRAVKTGVFTVKMFLNYLDNYGQ